MRIPRPPARDKTAPDLLVIANPVWEESSLLPEIPAESFDPGATRQVVHDGGGSALNSACALALAGWNVVAVGRVGDDPQGRASVEALRRRGVTPWIEIVRGGRTRTVRLFVEERTGATAFQALFPAGPGMAPTEKRDDLARARVLLLDRLGAPAISWLRKRRSIDGLLNALDVNAPPRSPRSAGWLDAALPLLDILQIPEGEDGVALGVAPSARAPGPALPTPVAHGPLAMSAGDPSAFTIHRPSAFAPLRAAEIEAILSAGVEWLIRTRGSRGAILHEAGGRSWDLPSKVGAVLDPTGAGDALAAGLLDGLLRGAGAREALERGLEWAARACRHLGARGWLDHEPPYSH